MSIKHKIRLSSILQIIAGLLIAVVAAVIYVTQLNKAVTHNTMSEVTELSQHDKRSMEAFINTCWDELEGMAERFSSYKCNTILEIESRMNLECATSNFSHIYLLAEDGKIYTDKYVVYDQTGNGQDRKVDLLQFFEHGEERVVTRWDDRATSAGVSKEYVLYGIRLDDFEVGGNKMLGLVALSETSTIQDYIVFDNFLKEDVRRGYSAVISKSGDYVIHAEKNFYLNDADSLFYDLSTGSQAELTNDEIAEKMESSETFDFHYTDAKGVRKLLYLTPFGDNIDWYFLMVVENEVFAERSKTFAALSAALLVTVMLVVILIMTILTAAHNRAVRISEKAKAQSEFLSNMSHEIRTPLNGLIGLNHLIMQHIDEQGREAQIKDWLKKSHNTADYLLSLVNDVLDMSKLQSGRVDIIQEPVMLETLIDAVWSMQRHNIESRGVRFIIQQDIQFPCVIGDSTRIKQVLMNIVSNAAKFTPKGGTITLSVSQEKTDGDFVATTYRCEDTGVGMSEEFLDQIFDAFSQERNKNSDSIKGTGLGMSISKLLVNAMGGKIFVESKLNAGTIFTVTLPSKTAEFKPEDMAHHLEKKKTEENIIPCRTESARPEGTCITGCPSGIPCETVRSTSDTGCPSGIQSDKPARVLVAEDNPLNAEILVDILTDEGFEVVHMEDGKKAVDAFVQSDAGEFDIILMDMQMPVMDGCEATRQIRGLDRPDAKTVVIYACTANTFKEDRDRAMESGMDDFLCKPIDIDILLTKLAEAGRQQKII